MKFLRNWKTTLAGLLTIAAPVLAGLFPEFAPLILKGSAVITGGGLILARDADKSTEQTKQEKP